MASRTTAAAAPTCPACGNQPGRHRLFCPDCWAFVPTRLREAIDKGWRAYRRHPTSRNARVAYDVAVAEAVEAAAPAQGGRR